MEVEGDRRFVAQAAAYRLAHMLSRRGHRVSVRLTGDPVDRRAEASVRRRAMRVV
jgi:hypothetical protein